MEHANAKSLAENKELIEVTFVPMSITRNATAVYRLLINSRKAVNDRYRYRTAVNGDSVGTVKHVFEDCINQKEKKKERKGICEH